MEFLESLDQGTWNFFQASHAQRPLLSQIMVWVNRLTAPPILAGLTALAGAILIYQRRLREAALLAAVFAGGCVLAYLTQQLIDRRMPQVLHNPLELPRTGPSFPCEQTLLATVVFLGLPGLALPPWRNRLIGAGAILVFLVGVSRIYVCHGYVTDVFASLLAGYALALTYRSLAVEPNHAA
jgi:membrane-associated phospholipid phosphatase